MSNYVNKVSAARQFGCMRAHLLKANDERLGVHVEKRYPLSIQKLMGERRRRRRTSRNFYTTYGTHIQLRLSLLVCRFSFVLSFIRLSFVIRCPCCLFFSSLSSIYFYSFFFISYLSWTPFGWTGWRLVLWRTLLHQLRMLGPAQHSTAQQRNMKVLLVRS